MSSVRYNNLLFDICEKLDELHNIKRLRFMCRGKIAKGSEDSIMDARSLFLELEEQGHLGIDCLDDLRELLRELGEWELLRKVLEFESTREEVKKLQEESHRMEGKATRVLSSAKWAGEKMLGAINIHCNFRTIGGGVVVVGAAVVLRKCSTLPEFMDAFTKAVLPAATKLCAITEGSVCFTVQAENLSALQVLWQQHQDGTLRRKLHFFLITEEINQLADGQEVVVNITIIEEEYKEGCLELMTAEMKAFDEEPPLLVRQRESDSIQVPPEIFARGPSAVEAYNKALAEGKTRVKRVPVMLIGQDRSGKTSVKKSLMGKPFDPEEGSTVGVEVDPSYFEVSTEIWKTKQGNEGAKSYPGISYEHHVARLIVGSLKKEGTTSKDRNARDRHSEATEAASDVEGASERNLDLAADVVSHPCSQSAGSQEDDPPLIVPEEVPEDVATLITELLKDVDKVEEEEEVYSVLWDFGGQSVYYATHPLFLTPRAIYLLVWDLSRNLHGRAVPIAKQGMCEELHDTYCGKTNGDFLDLWMSSVASLASQDEVNPESLESKKLPNMLPPVLLVCTHADKPYGNVDSKKLARKIFGFLLGKPYSNHLFDEFFALDNTKSGSGQECPETIRLRREVHALAKELPQMKEDIPLKWLKFEKAIRVVSEKGHKWIPLNEARQVAVEVCKIVSDEEFSTLLNFLHDQRILMHFSDTPKLNTMVILNLHWLIDVFKKVITVKPYDRKEKEFTDEWNKLEKTGILENKLLEHVWGPLFDQQETAAGLIAIMEKFSLLCLWPFPKGSQQYLVPSMLMSHPTEGVLNLLASARVASLFVKFDSGQVPQGFFPRLVLQFFQWCTEEWSSQLQPELFHNFARFYTRPEEGCSVILLCHSTSIEIVVHGGSRVRHHSDDLAGNVQSKMTLNEEFRHDTSDVITCRSVRRQLGLILNSMREEFWWLKHVKCEMCVCCTVCCHSGSMKYCRTHITEGCKQEECLHFLSESELRNSHQPIFCNKNAVAKDNKIQVQQFAPWFSFLDEQNEAGDLDERAERLFLATAGHDEQFALALPSGVLETLQSKTSDAKDVVVQLQESLQLDRAALEQPKPETTQVIRCLAKKAKCENRLDVVKYLRTITPAGTTGPLLPEDHDVRNIPARLRRDLTINLCGEDEWKKVAESLGLTPAEIRYLDNRTINPADAALAHSGNQCYTSVGNLYDVLVDCQMPQYADFL